jgi:hypothetical protein
VHVSLLVARSWSPHTLRGRIFLTSARNVGTTTSLTSKKSDRHEMEAVKGRPASRCKWLYLGRSDWIWYRAFTMPLYVHMRQPSGSSTPTARTRKCSQAFSRTSKCAVTCTPSHRSVPRSRAALPCSGGSCEGRKPISCSAVMQSSCRRCAFFARVPTSIRRTIGGEGSAATTR